MRKSRLHLLDASLVPTSWVVAVVGGGVLSLLILFLLSLPMAVGNGHGVWNRDLPVAPRLPTATEMDGRLSFVVLTQSGAVMVDGEWVESRELAAAFPGPSADWPTCVALWAHAKAPAKELERVLEAARHAGVAQFQLGVRNEASDVAGWPIPTDRASASLPEDAVVQDFVNALAKETR
ncbi:MAG: biopolymer transporter ExbD [Planctomycetota bacterium]